MLGNCCARIKGVISRCCSIKKSTVSNTTIIETLGTGVYSTVYKIKRNGTIFICKEIDIRYRNNLLREKIMLDRINTKCKSITDYPVLIEYGSNDKVWWLITEYQKGRELFGWFNETIITKNKLDIRIIKKVFLEMVRLVAQLHALDIVHLDIKMENFIILDTGNTNNIKLRLIDFDTAHDYTETMRNTTRFVGTIGYGDYHTSNGQYSNKSDIWSLGICLWILLENKFPFNHSKIKYKTNIDPMLFIMPTNTNTYIYKNYEETAIPLLRKMLNIDPDKISPIREILTDPWLNDIGG